MNFLLLVTVFNMNVGAPIYTIQHEFPTQESCGSAGGTIVEWQQAFGGKDILVDYRCIEVPVIKVEKSWWQW